MEKSKYGFKTTRARSRLMSKIKSIDTKPEILLRKKLKKSGHEFSIHCDNIPGTPDIIFIKKNCNIY